jgi:lipopolysaccharide biosynthesis regulator YciM
MWEAARQDARDAKLPVEDHLAAIEGLVANFLRGGLFDRGEQLAVMLHWCYGSGLGV